MIFLSSTFHLPGAMPSGDTFAKSQETPESLNSFRVQNYEEKMEWQCVQALGRFLGRNIVGYYIFCPMMIKNFMQN